MTPVVCAAPRAPRCPPNWTLARADHSCVYRYRTTGIAITHFSLSFVRNRVSQCCLSSSRAIACLSHADGRVRCNTTSLTPARTRGSRLHSQPEPKSSISAFTDWLSCEARVPILAIAPPCHLKVNCIISFVYFQNIAFKIYPSRPSCLPA